MQRSAAGSLRLLSVVMGGFLLLMAFGKTGWLFDSGPLADELWGWRESAPPLSRWYLDTVAIPGAPVFARLVPVGEFLTGAALVVGFRARLAAGIALLMVLNFHFGMGLLFQLAYLTNGYGPPVVGSLAALALGPARLPFSLHR
ncbi:MAG: hypothetical protein O3A25_05220 [Acidobacteria bacterium]|nr:hypothetical protein [Acidobacteriota bacterium]